MNNRTFLDIDDTILTKNLILPENASRDDNLIKQSDSKPFLVIQPTPGICIKTKTDAGEKIFLNICVSDKMPQPDDISDAKLFEILSEENPQFVIPMSIGSERLESDRGGYPCKTYDIAINTTYFEKCQRKQIFLFFTISVVMEGVLDKFNISFNTQDYAILKNRKVMGKLHQHIIKNREPRIHLQTQKPLIEEINSTTDINEKKDKVNQSKIISSEIVSNSERNYVLLKQPLEGPPTHLIGLFEISKGITKKEVEVFLDQDRIVVTVEKTGLTYDLSIPYTINVAHAKCFLDKDLGVLRLDMPIESALDNIQTN
ncbi:PIH1 domain-containing protein 1 [Habropoda laboriosa]|uniref:PIH1 domain-containing protein 1 n=1 Tax=Habropoda laboriosa TaxID=597456 RepID=A0A0L7QY28_9HYME|nr:PREDICTED: PIH1 domain-containing protein 1-like [Habropoda laboriosa]KOC63518.1 PIH1 domain-containing protein 1 [Habropoda laboriosa]